MTAKSRIAATIAVGAPLVLALAGCGLFHPQDYSAEAPTVTATSNPAEVTADDFGHSWGLSVDRGSVGCAMNASGDPVLTFTAPDGVSYALNSVPENRDRPDIGEIANGSVGALRSFAFSVCDR